MNHRHALLAIGIVYLSTPCVTSAASEEPSKEEVVEYVGFDFGTHSAHAPAGDDAAPLHVFVHQYPFARAGFVTAVRYRNDRDAGREVGETAHLLILRPSARGWDVIHRVPLSDDDPPSESGETIHRLKTPLAVEPGYVFGHWQIGPNGPIPLSTDANHIDGLSLGKHGFESRDVEVGRLVPKDGFSGQRDYFIQLEFRPAGSDLKGQVARSPAETQPQAGPAKAASIPAQATRPPVPPDRPLPAALEITADVVLDAGREYGPLVIKASDITIDGRGAWLTGSTEQPTNRRQGNAIVADGVSNVTLRNINAKGWETGLRISNASDWTIENCNFSDNFHDPAFGWGENGRRGGIVLENVTGFTIRDCRANRVWDSCVLVGSHDNTIEECDFSHASNTCLKLWKSCRNTVRRNNLSYGLRISPGEVHARDSTCVLIETASNDNRFSDNDCTHGGDGIFIRVLNGVVSTGNRFERNDCSYANNNCVEAWSPRNTYIENKANHGSYGFWLGASDQTVLLNNEACFNGLPDGFHNSPHLPGGRHAGIVFMFGPSSHTIVRGNRCIGNQGAGIALIGDLASQGRRWKAFHWIIEKNLLAENVWGVFAQHADWIDMAGNVFRENRQTAVHVAENVTNLFEHDSDPQIKDSPRAELEGPEFAQVGQPVVFDATGSEDPTRRDLTYRWDLGDGTISREPFVKHTFAAPGFHRVGLTVNNGVFSDLAWRDLYVVEDRAEIGTEGAAAQWRWIDPASEVKFRDDAEVYVSGKTAVAARVEPYSGGRLRLQYPASRDAALTLAEDSHIVFWLRALNENIPAWQETNPVLTVYERTNRFVRLTPKQDRLTHRANNEEREGWTYFRVPISGDEGWDREGELVETGNWLTIGLDSWGAAPFEIWIDGLAVTP